MLSPFTRGLLPCVLLLSVSVPGHAESEVPLHGPPIRFEEAIGRTLERNPDLAVFSYQFRAQDGRTLQAGLAPNPTLNLTIEDALGTGSRSGFRTAEQTISLSQVLERGARERRVAAAQAGREVLDAELLEKLVDTAAEAACVFRAKPATDSEASRPPIPSDVGRAFRRMPATL